MRTRPPQSVPAHHREPQRNGGERVRHGDFAVRAESDVPPTSECGEAGAHLLLRGRQFGGQTSDPRDLALSEMVIDSNAQIFDVHAPKVRRGSKGQVDGEARAGG